ncbi:MAG: hypothetical protein ACI353_06080 [Alloprevotella sp.]
MNRKTMAKYLDMIEEAGLLYKERVGKVNYYINKPLVNLFLNYADFAKETPVIKPFTE